MDIKRDKYLNDLINRMHNGMIKVVTGIRRCGKSYLLFNIFKNYLLEHGVTASHIITIELDQRKNKKYRDPDTILDYIESLIEDDEQYYIMLDEVQMLQEFEEVLNSLLHIRNADIYVTGSNSKFLSKDVITEFRGRGDEIHIYPLRVIETLYLYYPQWCLIQILIAQNEKELDMLFGRNKLSGMTQEEVDNCIQEYIKALDLVSKNIKPENANWSTSVYDNSAKILPQIISRLCYKCSIEILDQILDYMLILCSSNVRDNFKGINKILEGVCNAYTEKEQGERIEKILRFPMKTNERRTYYDPVNYLKRPKEKYKINDDLYNNIIIQIRQLMEIGTAQEKADALQRLIILAQLIYLKQNDEEYLYQCLEKKQTCEHQNILYHLNKERYKLNDDLILKNTLQLMEQDSNKQYFSSHTGSYRELIDILPDVQSDAIDYKKIFSVMTKLIKTNIDRKNDQQTAFQIEERSKQSYRIAVGLLLLKIKKKEIISIEEKEVIEEYFKTLQEYYNASNVLEFIEKLLLEKLNISEDIYTNMEEKLWLHSEEDINLLQIFYLETSRIKIDIKQMKRFGTFSNMVYQMAIYRIINTEISNVMPVLRLLYALVVNNIIVERETKLLFINLPRLMKDTTIRVEDFEKEARHKLNCRREICVIVSEYYKKGERNNNVLEWMELTKNSNEFVEIRNIEFE